MEARTIIGAIAAVAAIAGISFALHSYSSETYDYPPFNLVTIGISFVCGLLIAVGVYLLSGPGLTANTLVFFLGGGILLYVGLLVFVTLRSNIWIAIGTVTIFSALPPVVILVLRRVFRREVASLDEPEDPCRTYGNRSSDGPRQTTLECPIHEVPMVLRRRRTWPYGSFWGCPRYHTDRCTYTEPYD